MIVPKPNDSVLPDQPTPGSHFCWEEQVEISQTVRGMNKIRQQLGSEFGQWLSYKPGPNGAIPFSEGSKQSIKRGESLCYKCVYGKE